MTHLEALANPTFGSRVRVMGIVNRTPDSFFDGGNHLGDEAGRSHVDALVHAGADVLDLGAESTRPGAEAIDARMQVERLGDLLAYAISRGCPVSVDTTLPEVAEHALKLGARMVNSVSLEHARELGELAARFGADLVLTHCRGAMSAMRGFSDYASDGYGDVVDDVVREWQRAADHALAAGVARDRLWFDPGLGFTKNASQSLELVVRLPELKSKLQHPVLIGASRKSYVAVVAASALDSHAHEGGHPRSPVAPPHARLGGSLAAALDAARRGADMLRVHDVAETVQALAYQRATAALESDVPAAVTRPPTFDRHGGSPCSRD